MPSPKVATYDLKPEMSALEVTEKLLAAIESERFDFILVNFANCDMVGHTGIMEAAMKAVEVVDTCVGRVLAAIRAKGGAALITTLSYTPFVFLPVAALLRGLDNAWEDTARSLGLGPWRTFARIVLQPLAQPDSSRHVLLLQPMSARLPPRPEATDADAAALEGCRTLVDHLGAEVPADRTLRTEVRALDEDTSAVYCLVSGPEPLPLA